MRIKDGYVMRQIAGQYMAIPIGNRVNELHGFIALNETGAFLWNQLSSEKSEQDLVMSLMDEYDVSEGAAIESVIEYIEVLRKNGFLEE